MDITQKDVLHKDLQNLIIKALQNIESIPQNPFRNIQDFKASFDFINGRNGIIHTPYKDVKVNMIYAWRHFTQNTYNKNRDSIKGGFFSTFKDPLFVVAQERDKQHSVYFYKPFLDDSKKLINIFGIALDSNEKVNFKTYYLDSGNRIENLLNDKDLQIKYIKALA